MNKIKFLLVAVCCIPATLAFKDASAQITVGPVNFNYYISDPEAPPTTEYSVYAVLETSEGNLYPIPIGEVTGQGLKYLPQVINFPGVVPPNPMPRYPYRIIVMVYRGSIVRTGVSDWANEEGLYPCTPNPIKVQQF